MPGTRSYGMKRTDLGRSLMSAEVTVSKNTEVLEKRAQGVENGDGGHTVVDVHRTIAGSISSL